jgi:hypothetical protein
MKTFFKKLEQLVDIMDNELQQPISKVLTGEVFTHDPTFHARYGSAEQSTPQIAQPVVRAANPTRDSRRTDNTAICPPVLRPAGAHKK